MKRRAKSAKIFDSLRNKTQFSISPQRFRFNKFDHKKLGVIHPESVKIVKQKTQCTIPQPSTYLPGDAEYMQINGKKCPITNVEPDIIYSNKDRPPLDQHLIQPFFYIQKLFPRGRSVNETALIHPDVFIDFTTLQESKRNNKNKYNTDYVKILKSMTKEERSNFYSKSLNMNIEYGLIFKRFIKSLLHSGIINQNYKMSFVDPKIHRRTIEEQCVKWNLIKRIAKPGQAIIKTIQIKKYAPPKMIKEYDQLPITYENMKKLFQNYNYPQECSELDVDILFQNVNIGDSPLNLLMMDKIDDKKQISLSSFLYNVQKYMKLKYKVKNIFSLNAAKLRNVYIKFSLYPFLGEGWKIFKGALKQLKQCEQSIDLPEYKQFIEQRNQLILTKRIWAKHLQKTPLPFLLLKFNQIKDVYVETINYNSNRIEIFNRFHVELFQNKLELIQRLNNSRYFEQQSTNLLTEDITLEEAVDFMIQRLYPKDETDLIVEMLEKTLKFFGFKTPPKKSVYQTVPINQPTLKLHQEQIFQFLGHYTQKQSQEWEIFKTFLLEFHQFVEAKLLMPEDRLLNVRKVWECNMVGEWLMKKMKKMDKMIESLLGRSIQVIRIKQPRSQEDIINAINQDSRITFNQFLSEEVQNEIQSIINLQQKENQTTQVSTWDQDLNKAIEKYKEIAFDLKNMNAQIKQVTKPQEQVVISAANFIDDQQSALFNSVQQQQQQQQQSPKHSGNSQLQNQQLENKKLLDKGNQTKQNDHKNIKESNTNAEQLKMQNQSKITSSTTLTEAELDQKILAAQLKQNKIISTLDQIRHTSSFSYQF